MNRRARLLQFAVLAILAAGLFFAGAAWRSRRVSSGDGTPAISSPVATAQNASDHNASSQPGYASNSAPVDARSPLAPEDDQNEDDQSASFAAGQKNSGQVVINGRALSQPQIQELINTYGAVAPAGRYWYDTRSGMWGIEGRELMGFLRAGHDFGPLAANASRGNTGVFINGREINMAEAAYYQRLAGRVYQGHWWIDGRGNVGLDGNPAPVGNIFAAMQQSQRNAQQGGFWKKSVDGLVGASDGNCSIVSTDSGSWETPGCSQ